jgi:hypothetical protein
VGGRERRFPGLEKKRAPASNQGSFRELKFKSR